MAIGFGVSSSRWADIHLDKETENAAAISYVAFLKQVLKAGDTFPALWGFDVMWTIKPESKYTIRFTAGTVMKEITLN